MAPLTQASFECEGVAVDLGHIRLNSTSGVAVEVYSTLSLSQGTDLATIDGFEATIKAADQQGNAWIWPETSELSLTLRLQPTGDTQPENTYELLRDLATAVLDANYWHKLPISPAAVEVEPDTAVIRVVLRLDDINASEAESLEYLGGRKRQVSSSLRVRPPKGVQVLRLQAVHLNVKISKPRKSETDYSALAMTDAESRKPPSREYEDLLLNGLEDTAGSADAATNLNFSTVYSTNPGFFTGLPFEDPDKSEDTVHMTSIVHHAMQAAMFGRRRRLPASVSRDKAWKLQALSEIVPAIWRPGHLAASVERALLMPTIEQVLMKITHREVSGSLAEDGEPMRSSIQSQLWDVLRQGAFEARQPLRIVPRAQFRPGHERSAPSCVSRFKDETSHPEDVVNENSTIDSVVDKLSPFDVFDDLIKDGDQSVSDGEGILCSQPLEPKEAAWPRCMLEKHLDGLDEKRFLFGGSTEDGPVETGPKFGPSNLEPPLVLMTDQACATTEMLAI